MSAVTDLLIPRPKRLDKAESDLVLGPRADLRYSGPKAGSEPAVRRLLRLLADWRIEVGGTGGSSSASGDASAIRLGIDHNLSVPSQGYQLSIDAGGVKLFATDGAGLFYGVITLQQWLRLHRSHDPQTPTRLPGVHIQDRHDFANRGVLLDISRNRVPTMETLFKLVELLASWKINQLQLYTEHTFAYEGHETVWRDASPMTAEEVRSLDAFCRQRFIDLVPNQNSLGHFHRWLVHEPYRALAECPDGVDHPFSDRREPFSLCPTDSKSLELLSDLYGQLLPNFSSRLFNVGLDETFDIGKGRSAATVSRRGRAGVYVEFLRAVHAMVGKSGKRVQFWADIALEMTELVKRIPRDAIALDWGYEAHHPFATETATLADSGLDFYVCPGTSSWNSLAGRGRNAVLNLASAVLAGMETGAIGFLIADWGDNGHLQTLPASYPGFLAGAAFAWNSVEARQPFDLNTAA
ncbi:MAG: family 20 glycosylhydrolase, partial [Acidobacteriota bacterium]|nr:family 20 glycosylhydrolase [Acidobacteriota bacterium]